MPANTPMRVSCSRQSEAFFDAFAAFGAGAIRSTIATIETNRTAEPSHGHNIARQAFAHQEMTSKLTLQ